MNFCFNRELGIYLVGCRSKKEDFGRNQDDTPDRKERKVSGRRFWIGLGHTSESKLKKKGSQSASLVSVTIFTLPAGEGGLATKKSGICKK